MLTSNLLEYAKLSVPKLSQALGLKKYISLFPMNRKI